MSIFQKSIGLYGYNFTESYGGFLRNDSKIFYFEE